MGEAVSNGAGVALSPVSIIAVMLLLATPNGRRNGPAFLAGWLVGIAVPGIAALLIADDTHGRTSSAQPTWVSVVDIVLGALLLAVAAWQWRRRPRAGHDRRAPAWLQAIDRFTPVRSAAGAIVLSTFNLKNLLLVITAATAIAQTRARTGRQVADFAVFVVIAMLGIAVPVTIAFAGGDRATPLLDGLHSWMARRSTIVAVLVCVLIGVSLIGYGIAGFSG